MTPMSDLGRVHSINLSAGGVPKRAVPRATLVSLGFHGDVQKDKKHHGGPDRAVSLWSLEVIRALAEEGHRLEPGAAGENVTVEGLVWSSVVPGVRLALGQEILVEIASYAAPCNTIRHCFLENDFTRISHKLHPGTSRVYARVIRSGELAEGDRIVVLPKEERRRDTEDTEI
jgi:MOSC domain-containing protein YiiM